MITKACASIHSLCVHIPHARSQSLLRYVTVLTAMLFIVAADSNFVRMDAQHNPSRLTLEQYLQDSCTSTQTIRGFSNSMAPSLGVFAPKPAPYRVDTAKSFTSDSRTRNRGTKKRISCTNGRMILFVQKSTVHGRTATKAPGMLNKPGPNWE